MTFNKKKELITSKVEKLLSDPLFPTLETEDDNKKDPLASKVWRMYTKAKDHLPNGSRIENLTWRMMAMSLTKKALKEKTENELNTSMQNEKRTTIKKSIDIQKFTPTKRRLDYDTNISEEPLRVTTDNLNYSPHQNTIYSPQDHHGLYSPQEIHGDYSLSPMINSSLLQHHPYHPPHPMDDASLNFYSNPTEPDLDQLNFEHMLNNYYPLPALTQEAESSTTTTSPRSILSSPHSIASLEYEDSPSLKKIKYLKKHHTKCSNCQTTTTPLWRRDSQGNALCNACGLFFKLHGSVRPLCLKTDVIKKRNRSHPPPQPKKQPKVKNNSKKKQVQIAPSVDDTTHMAIQAILQSIGIHLDHVPPELLPLIASAANYQAMNKQRQQKNLNDLLSNFSN